MGISDDIGEMATAIDDWLDGDIPDTYKIQPLAQDWARIAKLKEERGEVVDAFMGLTGNNPRKGVYSAREAMLSELADVAITAVLAIQHFTKTWTATEEILWDKLLDVYARVPEAYRKE